MREIINAGKEVYLNAQRFCIFLKDFEKFSEQDKKICIERIRNQYPDQAIMLIHYFVDDVIRVPQYSLMKKDLV